MTIGKILGKQYDTRQFAPDPRLLLPTCHIGVEFEFEGTDAVARENPRNLFFPFLEAHEERSLRDRGLELAFREPLFGRDALHAIQLVCNRAKEHNWRVSHRTGIHVHLDVRDIDSPKLVGMCLLYSLLEPAIYRWVGDNRENNVFCLPWYVAEDGIIEAAEVIKGALADAEKEEGNLLAAARNYQRYAGFNLNALYKFGSIEFRHLKTTADFDRILEWINLLMALKDGTNRIPLSDGALVKEIEYRGPVNVMHHILGEKYFNMLNYPDFERDVYETGLATAHSLVKAGFTSGVNWKRVTKKAGSTEPNPNFLKYKKKIAEVAPAPERGQIPAQPPLGEDPLARARRFFVEARIDPIQQPRIWEQWPADGAQPVANDQWVVNEGNNIMIDFLQPNDGGQVRAPVINPIRVRR